ncbi:MAG TPA: hypothetical protein VJT14_00585 [Candidatus Dormibacteraeota bacterium]|nr:hypothetical protein [Candidatus Dormibacteraeota bacterium]
MSDLSPCGAHRAAEGLGCGAASLTGRPPQPLMRRGVREEVPVDFDQGQERLDRGRAHGRPAARRSSEEDEARNLLRVAGSINQHVRARVVLTEQVDLGESDLLPGDFLIAPSGQIKAAKYGTHAYDQWSVDELIALAKGAAVRAA